MGRHLVGVGAAGLVLALAGIGCQRPPSVAGTQPAAASPIEYARPAFKFRFPPRWTIDTADPDYEPDHNLTLDCGPTAFVMFIIHDEEEDVKHKLDLRQSAHRKNYTPLRSEAGFTTWGKYTGRGVTLRGRNKGVDSMTRLFIFNAGGKTVNVTEFCPDSKRADVLSEFQMIEQSFEMTK